MIDPADINLPALLGRWYGPPDCSEWQVPEGYPGIPHPLREWYSLAYRWEGIRSVEHQIYEPRKIRLNQGRIEFAADSTGDWFWAVDAEDSNSVYEAELGGEWRLVPESLPEFLIHATLKEAAILASFGRTCSQVPNEILPDVLVGVEEVDFGGWEWPRPGRRMFMNEVLIMEIGPAMDFRAPRRNREGFSFVRASGISAESLSHLDGISSVKWQIYSTVGRHDS
ncbi:hypothetical protein GT030_01570 [Streptomyces sp. SID1328]|uniref:hypothetical protein n=1 Tax=Streptomyces sp. SID1328 TaxID=2690250 RepID=UPI0013699A00|nr:hypothetical protein [Streptomyces sp. SID1328]MYV37585.1 hypothetical protein [Streptomyces sp. SID1328]